MSLLDLLNEGGGPIRRVSGTNGGEYAGPCPSCGGDDRFRVWPGQGEGGRFWCRGCNKHGDAIQYLRDFRGLSYLEACHFLGREPKNRHVPIRERGLRQARTRPSSPTWEPRESSLPGEVWTQKTGRFVEWSQRMLWANQGKEAREWLHGRGFSDETIRKFRLGWNPRDWRLKRSTWGLPEEPGKYGKPKKLWLPLGLVIPKTTGDWVGRVRIRKPEGEPRYYLLPGSETGPLIVPGGPACVVVESELDAMLIHQDAGDLVTTIALGSVALRPDRPAAETILAGGTLLLSLDADDAGAKEAWSWWRIHFPNAKRWPTIMGKDPSEARQNGLDLRAWITAALLPDEETGGIHEPLEGEREQDEGPGKPSGVDEGMPGLGGDLGEPSGRVKCNRCVRLDEHFQCTQGHRMPGGELLHVCLSFRPAGHGQARQGQEG